MATSKKKQLDLSASFRVKIDSKSNWHLKAIVNNERLKKHHHNHNHQQQLNKYNQHKLSRNLSQSSNSIDQMNRPSHHRTIDSTRLDPSGAEMSMTTTTGGSSSLSKRKSSSTSYLNEEDDYDDDYDASLSMSMNMKQFKQAQRLSKVLNETSATTNGAAPALADANPTENDAATGGDDQQQQKKIPTLSARNSIENKENNEEGTKQPQQSPAVTVTQITQNGAAAGSSSVPSLSDLKSDASSSSASENSDYEHDDDEIDPDLYDIDEYEEVFPSLEYESSKRIVVHSIYH